MLGSFKYKHFLVEYAPKPPLGACAYAHTINDLALRTEGWTFIGRGTIFECLIIVQV